MDDLYEYGNGLNAARYSEFLKSQKGQDSEYYIQGRSLYGGTEIEGVVEFDSKDLLNCEIRNGGIDPAEFEDADVDDGEFAVNLRYEVCFSTNMLNEPRATVSADVYTSEEMDKETLLRIFSGVNRISVPVSPVSDTKVDLDLGPIPDPDDPEIMDETYGRGVRLSHTLDIGKCKGGIGEARMEQIYELTLAMILYTLDMVSSASQR